MGWKGIQQSVVQGWEFDPGQQNVCRAVLFEDYLEGCMYVFFLLKSCQYRTFPFTYMGERQSTWVQLKDPGLTPEF